MGARIDPGPAGTELFMNEEEDRYKPEKESGQEWCA
jgi:hypothetical protein